MSLALNKLHPSFLRRLRFREMMLCCAVLCVCGKGEFVLDLECLHRVEDSLGEILQ